MVSRSETGDLVWAPSPPSGAGKLRGCGLGPPYHFLTRLGVSAVVPVYWQQVWDEAFLCSWFSESLMLVPLSENQASNLSHVRLVRRVPELTLASAQYPEAVLTVFRACSLDHWLRHH